MPFDVQNPLLADLDLALQNLDQSILEFEDSADIAIELVNEGVGVRWNLVPQTPVYVELADADAITLTSGISLNVLQLTVPAGKRMLVTGCVVFKPNPSVTSSLVAGGVSAVSAALPAIGQHLAMQWSGVNVVRFQSPIPERFLDNSAGSSDITVFLVAQCIFSSGAVSVSGWLRGRLVP